MKRRNRPSNRTPPAKKVKFSNFETPDFIPPKEEVPISNDDLMDLKPNEIAVLRNFKKEGVDDMDKLSHLESSKTKYFEKAKEEEPDDFDPDTVERFTTEAEETIRCLRDPLLKLKTSTKKERQNAIEDSWYTDYMEKQRNKSANESFLSTEAIHARAKRQKKKEQDQNEDDEDIDKLDNKELITQIVSYLNENETISSALRRINGKPIGKRNRRKNIEIQIPKGDKVKIEKLTELATLCSSRKLFMDIYSIKREDLLKKIGLEMNINEKKSDKSDEILWEYKTSINDSNIFGPFPTSSMKLWQKQGYFQGDIPIRKVGTNEFISASNVNFDL